MSPFSAPGSLLEGVRILDVSRVLAGPLASQILGDLGAEVLKIEAPWGDDTRGWGPPFHEGVATYYQACNRNRASLVLDLKEPAQRARLLELVGVVDVVIDNFTPASRARLDLGAAALREIKPDLVTLSITGYSGSRADEPGYDLVLQAESGLMAITGAADGEPSKVGVAVVDVLTGMMAANAVLAALVRRGRTGEGASLSVSLLRTALFSLVNVASAALGTGEPSRRWGNAHPSLAPYEAFAAADRTIVIAVGTDRQWRGLCAEVGIEDPELLALDNAGRVARRDELASRITAWTSRLLAADVLARLARAHIPAAPVLRPEEALLAAQRFDPGVILAIGRDNGAGGEAAGTPLRAVASPIEGEGTRLDHRAPPALGQGGEELAQKWLTAGPDEHSPRRPPSAR